MKRFALIVLTLAMLISMVACGGNVANPSDTQKGNITMDMKAVYASIQKEVKLPEMLELNDTQMLNFCGIDKNLVKQAVVLICEDSLRTDEIWLLEAADETAVKELEKRSDSRLKSKGDESITYSPEQYAVVQKAALVKSGNYIALIVSPDVEALVKVFKQAAGL